MLPLEFILLAFWFVYVCIVRLIYYNKTQKRRERIKKLFVDDRPKYFN